MKSRKFPSFDEAINYCKSKGELTFYGRAGEQYEYCVYTLQIGNRVFHCNVYDSGLLQVVHERYG